MLILGDAAIIALGILIGNASWFIVLLILAEDDDEEEEDT